MPVGASRTAALLGLAKGTVRPLGVRGATVLARRRLQRLKSPFKLIVGGGGRSSPGWVSTDISWWKGIYLDVTGPWGIDGRVSHIVADNVIEHIRLDEARVFLRQAFASLVPEGVIRVLTPDAEAAARVYLHDPEEASRLLKILREEDRQPAYAPIDLLHATFHWWGHNNGHLYDLSTLSAELAAAGFTDIRRVDPQQEGHDAVFPPSSREASIQLIVEAGKP